MKPEYLPPFDNIYCFSSNADQECYELTVEALNFEPEEKKKKNDLDLAEEGYINIHPFFGGKTTKDIEAELLQTGKEQEFTSKKFQIYDDILLATPLLKWLKKRADKSNQVLVIFDDVCNAPKELAILETYWKTSRPSNISCIFLAQRIHTNIPPIVRSNSNAFIIFKPDTADEKKLLFRFFSDCDDFENIYNMTIREQYDYLLIDLITKEPWMKMRRKWSQILPPEYFEKRKKLGMIFVNN